MSVFAEDLGPEENPCGINSLPVDSPVIMIELSKERNTEVINEHLSDGIAAREILTLNDTLDRSAKETPIDTNSLSIDDLALLLVELNEKQASGELTEPLPSQALSSQICAPNESTEGNTPEELRVESEAPTAGHIGMGTCNDRVFRDGRQVVVNLSSRDLTQAEMSLLSKGLSFCPIPKEIDMFALRKDMFDYVRRLRLKEYYCGDDGVLRRKM